MRLEWSGEWSAQRAEITGGKITKNTRSNTRRPPLLSTLVHFLSAHLYFILFYFAFSSQIRSAGPDTKCFLSDNEGLRGGERRGENHYLLPGQAVSQ